MVRSVHFTSRRRTSYSHGNHQILSTRMMPSSIPSASSVATNSRFWSRNAHSLLAARSCPSRQSPVEWSVLSNRIQVFDLIQPMLWGNVCLGGHLERGWHVRKLAEDCLGPKDEDLRVASDVAGRPDRVLELLPCHRSPRCAPSWDSVNSSPTKGLVCRSRVARSLRRTAS